MTFYTSEIYKKLKIHRSNIKHYIDSIPLNKGTDYDYTLVGNIKLMFFSQTGYNKLKNRNRKTGRKPFKIKG